MKNDKSTLDYTYQEFVFWSNVSICIYNIATFPQSSISHGALQPPPEKMLDLYSATEGIHVWAEGAGIRARVAA